MRRSRALPLSLILAGCLGHPTARAATPVIIVTPQNGDVVPPKFTVEITYGDVFYGDTDNTGDAPADSVELWSDSVLLARCSPCPNPHEATFEVELMPGEHELVAQASYLSAWESSEPVKITVAQEKEAEGCACNTASPHDHGLLWLGIPGLLLRRRRARADESRPA